MISEDHLKTFKDFFERYQEVGNYFRCGAFRRLSKISRSLYKLFAVDMR